MAADEIKKDESEEQGFKVTDRRRFEVDASGEVHARGEEPPPPPKKTVRQARRELPRELPPIDFTTFILSLGSSVMVHLGEMDDPETAERSVNLPLARQTIDMIAMIQEKTKGNLTAEEARYLEAMLYDLRVRCVEAARKSQAG